MEGTDFRRQGNSKCKALRRPGKELRECGEVPRGWPRVRGWDRENTQGLEAGVLGSSEFLSNTGANTTLLPGVNSTENRAGFPNWAGMENPGAKGRADVQVKTGTPRPLAALPFLPLPGPATSPLRDAVSSTPVHRGSAHCLAPSEHANTWLPRSETDVKAARCGRGCRIQEPVPAGWPWARGHGSSLPGGSHPPGPRRAMPLPSGR